MIVVVCGVSGVGKTTVGMQLAAALSLPFVDADDYHPESNVKKMSSGIPLDDADRQPWLQALARCMAEQEASGGAVLAISALREAHRTILGSRCGGEIIWVVLHAPRAVLADRLASRQGHFFNRDLLDSQLETLEVPEYAWLVDAEQSPPEIVNTLLERLREECTPEPQS